MKFTCTKENLLAALHTTSGVASKHGHLPILSHVLFVVEDSKVQLLATNLEIGIRFFLRARVDETGTFAVPAKTLADFVNLLRDEQVHLALEENELVITSGSSSTKIKGSPAEDFPVLPEIEELHGYGFAVEPFRGALASAAIAAAKNDIRPELAGVSFGFFTEAYKGLTLAATDSYRLAEKKVSVSEGSDTLSCIVPARTVFEITRLLGAKASVGGESTVRVWVNDNQIALRYDQFELTSRIIDGTYPDYTQIIPSEFTTTATIDHNALVNKIKAAGLFTTTGVNAVSFDLNAEQNTLGISSTSTQTGEHSAEIDAQVSGQENSILLNHRYVLEGLNQMSGEVEFSVNSGDAPCMFRQKDEPSYLYLVMPIRQ